jgi:hypothetical protein
MDINTKKLVDLINVICGKSPDKPSACGGITPSSCAAITTVPPAATSTVPSSATSTTGQTGQKNQSCPAQAPENTDPGSAGSAPSKPGNGGSSKSTLASDRVTNACVDALGFDTDAKLTLDTAKELKKTYRFCLRYVSRQNKEQLGDLDNKEVKAILDAGLALMVVQHVHSEEGWWPTPDNFDKIVNYGGPHANSFADLGTKEGENAAQHAIDAIDTSDAKVHFGVSLFLDLENLPNPTGMSEKQKSEYSKKVIDYCNNWYDAVKNAGFSPGIYLGYEIFLTNKQLLELKFEVFWRAYNVRASPKAGFAMTQKLQIDGKGEKIDLASKVKIDEDKITHEGLFWVERVPDV